MSISTAQKKIEEILEYADIQVNGDRPWDIKVHNNRFYSRLLAKGSLAMGESYMDGWWDCDHIDQLLTRIMQANLREQVAPLSLVWPGLQARLINMQSMGRAFQVGEAHYDLGNDLF